MTSTPAWRPIALQAAAMWLATRVALALLTYVTVIFNGFGNTRVPPGFVVGQWDLGTLIGSWARWDTGWFATIAQQGYATPDAAAFFPLYPLLIHLGVAVTGPRYLLEVLLVISNLAALIGFIGVALLAAHEHDPGPHATHPPEGEGECGAVCAPGAGRLSAGVLPGGALLRCAPAGGRGVRAALRAAGSLGVDRARGLSRSVHALDRRHSLSPGAVGIRPPAWLVGSRALARARSSTPPRMASLAARDHGDRRAALRVGLLRRLP